MSTTALETSSAQTRAPKLAPSDHGASGASGRTKGPLSIHLFCVAVIGLVAGGCSNQGMNDLYQFVQQTKATRRAEIDPLPAVKRFETFTYAGLDIRDPFLPPLEPEPEPEVIEQKGNGLSPDFDRPREELERFSLDSLRMVGTLSRDETTYGIVKGPSGNVYRVRNENYMGKNHGRIVAVTEHKIELTELVSDGADGWEERQAALALSE